MIALIISLIFPLCFYTASMLLVNKRLKLPAKADKAAKKAFKKELSQLRTRLSLMLMAEYLIIIVLLAVVGALMFGKPVFSPAAVAVSAALPFAHILAPLLSNDNRLRKLLKISAIAACVLFVSEVVVFNGKSFTKNETSKVYTQENITHDSNGFDENSETLTLTSDGSLSITDLPDNVKGVIVKLDQKRMSETKRDAYPFQCEIAFRDDNFDTTFITAQTKSIMAYDKDCDFTIRPYGDLKEIRLRFSLITNPVTVHSIKVVSALPFAFSAIRFFFLLALIVIIAVIKEYELYKISFNYHKRSHQIILDTLSVLLALSSFIFLKPDMKPEKYNKALPPIGNPYAMQAAAFDEHQVSLLYEPDESMDKVENIYSNDQRKNAGTVYLWDYAYKDGKYYCYFGISPTLVLFYPYQHFTGKVIPICMANFIFSALAVFFFCQTLLAAAKLLTPKCNLILLMLSMIAGVGCTGLYYTLTSVDLYCVPLCCGLMFLFLCLWQGFTAYLTKNKIKKLIKLAVSGTALAFAFGSRPGMALSAVVLVPFFLGILLDKKQQFSWRIKQAAFFTTPLIIGGIGIILYNNARFGSPFDFGASYQLTVSDIHANKLSLASLPAALFHYFFAGLKVRNTFPFFEQQFVSLGNYGAYTYVAGCIPAFTIPLIAAGFIAMPMVFRKKYTLCARGTSSLQRNAFYASCAIAAVFIAWTDFCLGGIIQRYVIDIMPLMTLAATAALLRINVAPHKRTYLYTLSAICICTSFLLNAMLVLSIRTGTLHMRCPNLFDTLEDLIVFWR